MAHRSQKLQFEIVAVLDLLALFTHNHLFWVIGLFLAMVDLPEPWSTRSIMRLESMSQIFSATPPWRADQRRRQR
jgi:hypothetical protein